MKPQTVKPELGQFVKTRTGIVGIVASKRANGFYTVIEARRVGQHIQLLPRWRRLVAASEIISVYSAGSWKAA